MTEAHFRRRLIALRLSLIREQNRIAEEMIPHAFGDKLPNDEQASLRALIAEISRDFDNHRQWIEAMLLSDGPVLKVEKPQH